MYCNVLEHFAVRLEKHEYKENSEDNELHSVS